MGSSLQVVANHLGHEMVNRLVVGDAGPDGIREADISIPVRFHQTGHAQARVFPKNLRIEEIVVDPAVDHVHRLEPLGGAHENLAILRDEVAPFHDLDAHRAGEERVLEVGRVVNARREEDHGRFALSVRRDIAQHV